MLKFHHSLSQLMICTVSMLRTPCYRVWSRDYGSITDLDCEYWCIVPRFLLERVLGVFRICHVESV